MQETQEANSEPCWQVMYVESGGDSENSLGSMCRPQPTQ